MSLEVSWLVETVLAALWRATWQGAVVVLAAAAVDSLWQSMPASLRSWMWRLVFVKIALAFCVSATIPLPLLPAAAPRAGEAAPLVATIAASAVDAPATRSGNGEPSGNGELSG
ncbi:MAG TPA: hypothetical protein VGE52_20920, partial [Pirellulales bacterium]